jgi:hypothetical protein
VRQSTTKRRRPWRLPAALAAALLAAAPLAATGAHADGLKLSAADLSRLDKKIELDYSVSGIGLALLSARFDIELNRRSYKATSVIKTEGIAGLIMRSRWDSVAEGNITRAGLEPKRFRTDVSTNQGRGAVHVKWDRTSYLISAIPEIKADRKADLNAKLAPKLPDPLSAVVTTAIFSASSPCTGKRRVFDGRRIFDISFRFEKAVNFKGGSGYSGPAYLCKVKHTPVAGQSKEDMADEKRSPSPYHQVWLAPVTLGGGGPKVLIPVKIDLQSGWTSTTIELTRSSIGGRPITVAAAN